MKQSKILLREAVFPRKCPYCGEIVDPAGALICADCEGKLPYLHGARCKICGKMLRGTPEAAESGLCQSCARYRRSFTRSLCLMEYDGTSREIMAALKYHHRKEYADTLAYLVYRRLGTAIRLLSPDILVPVPIHKKRRRARGYNQAEALSVSLCAFLNGDEEMILGMGAGRFLCEWVRANRAEEIKILLRHGVPREETGRLFRNVKTETEILQRSRNTAAQKELDPAHRLLNLRRAFAADLRPYLEQHGSVPPSVLLVDDIYTTGATLEACSRALLDAGVGKVYGLCICAGRDI